jgi:DNA-binding CsgD family transcriptional regulator
MPVKSGPRAKLAGRLNGDARGNNEVGRIELEERLFIIALASELPTQSTHRDLCRFAVAGVSLVVFEATDQHRSNASRAADDVARRLTGRELEIAVLVAQGYATKNIAYRLQISEWTVATYLRRIFAKLNVDSRAAMVYRCAPLIDRIADVCSSAKVGFASPPLRE